VINNDFLLKNHLIFLLRQESFQSTASAAAWVSFIVVALLFAGGSFVERSWDFSWTILCFLS
jgi:hypothetical protein